MGEEIEIREEVKEFAMKIEQKLRNHQEYPADSLRRLNWNMNQVFGSNWSERIEEYEFDMLLDVTLMAFFIHKKK